MTEEFRVEVVDRIATLTIDRPTRRNAIDTATLMGIRKALAGFGDDVDAVVITGAGGQAFSAGGDVKEYATMTPAERLRNTDLMQDTLDQVEYHPRPVIAAIEGFAFGGGLELALATDYRVAGGGAKFRLPEVSLGALPTGGSFVRLHRVVGIGRARELILFNRQLTPEQALDWGLVSEVVPEGTALERAQEVARLLLASSATSTITIAKQLITFGLDAPARSARFMEYLADKSQTASDAFEKGVAAFANEGKRPVPGVSRSSGTK
ncbi:MAG: enoyl-CoA hydratase [Chloroflexota bacterium]|jgi:enoyl-CoA hydratase|nr:enoyl-CoA hydratase [Chloroflexota bacterium]